MVLARRIVTGILAAIAAGCAADATLPDESTWRKALLDERAGTDAEFRAPASSPLSATDRHALRSGEAAYVHVDSSELRLADQGGDSAALSFQPAGAGRWSWEAAASGVAATLLDGDRPLAPGPVAALAVFRLGRFSIVAQPVPDSLVLMLHDSQREELRRFRGLDYFAPDRRYLVMARIERWSEPQQVTLPTSRRLEKSYRRRARLRFEIGGQPCELIALAPAGAPPGALFVPFRDATSGKSTYAGGRYLDLREPDGDTLAIDFNRAYNPMCNYSSAFNCPIPPAENRLRVAIEAGQKIHDH